jgi:hypothetical protein
LALAAMDDSSAEFMLASPSGARCATGRAAGRAG